MNIAAVFNNVIAYATYYNAKYNLKKELAAKKREDEKEKKKFQRLQSRYGMNFTYINGKSYPWSRLAKCKCGNKHPWMHGFPSGHPCNEIVRSDALYRVVCHRCFRHTDKGTYTQVVFEWNSRMKLDYQQIIDELKIIGVIRSSQ